MLSPILNDQIKRRFHIILRFLICPSIFKDRFFSEILQGIAKIIRSREFFVKFYKFGTLVLFNITYSARGKRQEPELFRPGSCLLPLKILASSKLRGP